MYGQGLSPAARTGCGIILPARPGPSNVHGSNCWKKREGCEWQQLAKYRGWLCAAQRCGAKEVTFRDEIRLKSFRNELTPTCCLGLVLPVWGSHPRGALATAGFCGGFQAGFVSECQLGLGSWLGTTRSQFGKASTAGKQRSSSCS